MRADLADIRLASQVFAPHYAAPMAMVAAAPAPIRVTPSATEELGALAIGDLFDVLEMTSAHCWGQHRGSRLVGYVAREALALPERKDVP